MKQRLLLQRRTLLQGIVGGLAAFSLAPVLRAASSAPAIVLAENISVLNIGGVNVVLALMDTEAALVDTGPRESFNDLSAQLQAVRAAYTLFNTHWHQDQTDSNNLIGVRKIIAHKKTQLRLETELYWPQKKQYWGVVPNATFSMETFYTNGSLAIGDETIDYGYLMQAHTDGDIYVYFRNANVLAVGDVVSPERDPALDWYGGGWLGGRVDAMDLLLEISNDATRFVPSYGPVVSKAQVQAERDMMAFLYEKLVDQVRMGYGAKDSFESGIMNGLPRTFADPQKFLYDAHKGLWAHHNKLAPNVV